MLNSVAAISSTEAVASVSVSHLGTGNREEVVAFILVGRQSNSMEFLPSANYKAVT